MCWNVAEKESRGLTCWECIKTGRHSERGVGGVSSIFSACPEKFTLNRWNRAYLARGWCTCRQSGACKLACCFTSDSPADQNASISLPESDRSYLHIHQSIIMKKGTLNFLGRKNQSLFDTNIKIKDMGESTADRA